MTAALGSVLVGGCGAPPVPKNRRRHGAALEAKECFSKIPKNFVLSSKFFDDPFFSHRKLQQNKYIATMALVARRQIIGGRAVIKKIQRRRPQIVGGVGAARPAHGSNSRSHYLLSIQNSEYH